MSKADWYTKKAKEHYEEWELATDLGDNVTADKAMTEYINYQELLKQVNINS